MKLPIVDVSKNLSNYANGEIRTKMDGKLAKHVKEARELAFGRKNNANLPIFKKEVIYFKNPKS